MPQYVVLYVMEKRTNPSVDGELLRSKSFISANDMNARSRAHQFLSQRAKKFKYRDYDIIPVSILCYVRDGVYAVEVTPKSEYPHYRDLYRTIQYLAENKRPLNGGFAL